MPKKPAIKAAPTVNITELWKSYRADMDEAKRLTKLAEEYTKNANLTKALLLAAIPSNSDRDGVHRTTYEKPNVPYKQILEAIKEKIIPKKRWPEITAIIEASTTKTTIDLLSESKPDGEPLLPPV